LVAGQIVTMTQEILSEAGLHLIRLSSYPTNVKKGGNGFLNF